MEWLFLVIGAVVAGPLAVGLTLWRVRRALRRARRLRDRARAKDHLIELAELTGGLAHEIRNPLSAINLNLKLLAEEFANAGDDARRRNLTRLKRLQGEVQRLNDILDEFLRYAGHMELQPTETDLRRLVDELVDFFRPQAESSHVVLRSDLPSRPVTCRVDLAHLKQAVLNVMINATQAMSDGGELLLRLRARGRDAALEVIDTGPGIPPDAREKIFDAYYSTRPGGSGLGLPATRRIVRGHGGDIEVDGEPGRGTRFVISLPLAGED